MLLSTGAPSGKSASARISAAIPSSRSTRRRTTRRSKVDLRLGEQRLKYEANPVFLGLTLDCQLAFSAHAKEVKRRMAARRALTAIAGRSTGTSQNNLRSAYIATTRAVADYASGVWLSKAQPLTRDAIEAQQNKCARVITGCLGVTRVPALLACADLPPMRHVSQERAACLFERMLRLPHDNPAWRTANSSTRSRLKSRTHESWHRGNEESTDAHRQFRGYWRRIAKEFDSVSKLDMLPREPNQHSNAPWNKTNNDIHFRFDLAEMKLKSEAEDERRKATNVLLDKIRKEEPFDIEVWTDGSARGGTTDGGGAAVVTTRVWSTILRTPAGRLCSSYQAEMEAIRMALEYFSTLDEDHGNDNDRLQIINGEIRHGTRKPRL